jgi:hypothetical protein
MDKYTHKIIQITIRILIHSSFCVLNVKLPACRPNFAEAARTTLKVEQARYRLQVLLPRWTLHTNHVRATAEITWLVTHCGQQQTEKVYVVVTNGHELGTCSVRIWAGMLSTPSDVFRGFSQSRQTNTTAVPRPSRPRPSNLSFTIDVTVNPARSGLLRVVKWTIKLKVTQQRDHSVKILG